MPAPSRAVRGALYSTPGLLGHGPPPAGCPRRQEARRDAAATRAWTRGGPRAHQAAGAGPAYNAPIFARAKITCIFFVMMSKSS